MPSHFGSDSWGWKSGIVLILKQTTLTLGWSSEWRSTNASLTFNFGRLEPGNHLQLQLITKYSHAIHGSSSTKRCTARIIHLATSSHVRRQDGRFLRITTGLCSFQLFSGPQQRANTGNITNTIRVLLCNNLLCCWTNPEPVIPQ